MPTNLKEVVRSAKKEVELEIARYLKNRPDITVAELAEIFGTSTGTIYRIRRDLNMAPRKRGPKPKPQTDKDTSND